MDWWWGDACGTIGDQKTEETLEKDSQRDIVTLFIQSRKCDKESNLGERGTHLLDVDTHRNKVQFRQCSHT